VSECRRLVPALAGKRVGVVINKAGSAASFEWRQVVEAIWSTAVGLLRKRGKNTATEATEMASFNGSGRVNGSSNAQHVPASQLGQPSAPTGRSGTA
jgi:hypothetical protein